MKVDFWFDFNHESLNTLKNFKAAVESFVKKDELTIGYRSFTTLDQNYSFHETYQYAKKINQGIDFLIKLEELYLNHKNIDDTIVELSNEFLLDLKLLKENVETNKSRKVVLNHTEHAMLQKISNTPEITFSHGFRLKGNQTEEEIKNTLILMYEKDTGIEYCEENCER